MVNDTRLVSGAMINTYRLAEQIGKGGFATVWSAWDTRLNRLVALKLLPLEAEDEVGLAQFSREAGMIAQLQHPFIVPLYDFGKTSEYRFLVMRYVIGGSLAHRLQQTNRLTIAETLRLVTLIASALDYVHDQQIAHRDLKPANILLDAQGLPYLSDFGLAKSIHQRALQHTLAGTLYYMSPEQYLGDQLTTQTDIYSLGILLYQLFAGGLPHGGNVSHGALQLRRGITERLPDITTLQPSLPPALNDLLWQMTAIDPHDRPISAQVVVERLSALFTAQGATSIEQDALKLLQGVNIGSTNYRRLEAERILQRTLPAWQRGELPLSLTEFVLLHDYLEETPMLVNRPVGTLMLRSAFEYGQFIDTWWSTSDMYRQCLACDHAVASGGEPALRALLVLKQLTSISANLNSLLALVDLRHKLTQHLAERLLPPSNLTEPALDVLESLLDRPLIWHTPPVEQHSLDQQLADVAVSDTPHADRVAALIGHTRRTGAVALLAKHPAATDQLMRVREAAGNLPNSITELTLVKRWQVELRLGWRQLARRPLNSFLQYDVAAAGSVFGVAWLIYSVYPDTPSKMLNVFGLGLLFGVLYALGLWSSRHITSELRVLDVRWRFLLAILVGGAIMAATFTVFNRTVYDEKLDMTLAVASGVLFVLGTVISFRWSRWLQLLLGTFSIMLALLIPWAGYLRYYDGADTFAFSTVPFVFNAATVADAIPTVLIAAALMMIGLVLGAKLFPYQPPDKRSVADPQVGKPDVATRILSDADIASDDVLTNHIPDQSNQTDPVTKVMPPP